MTYRVIKTFFYVIHLWFLTFLPSAEALNYAIISVNKYGLQEFRVALRGRLLMETSLMEAQSRDSLVYSRATDGIRLVQLVIRYGAIDNCIVSSSFQDILSFSIEHSRVQPEKMDSPEEDIMDVYLGYKKMTDSVLLSKHSNISSKHTFNTNSISTKLHEHFQGSSSFVYSKDLKLSTKIISFKDSSIVKMLMPRFRIRKNARDCRQFTKGARERLLMLSSLVQEELTLQNSMFTEYINSAEHDQLSTRDHLLHSPSQNLTTQNNGNLIHLDKHADDAAVSHTSIPLSLGYRYNDGKFTETVTSVTANPDSTADSSPPKVSESSLANEIVHTNTTPSSSSSSSSSPAFSYSLPLLVKPNDDGVRTLENLHEPSLTNNSLTDATLLKSVDGNDDVVNMTTNSMESNERYNSSQPGSPQSSLSHRRSKRDLLTGWMIFPGTKWCGDGDIAEHKKDLGYHVELDKCCRRHDLCPLLIPRLTWKYGMFNYRLHTLSHCRCDRKFRKCLKESTSQLAHLIGQIYFNVIGPQCFKFIQKTTCIQRHWWGGCSDWANSKVAFPKKQRMFK